MIVDLKEVLKLEVVRRLPENSHAVLDESVERSVLGVAVSEGSRASWRGFEMVRASSAFPVCASEVNIRRHDEQTA